MTARSHATLSIAYNLFLTSPGVTCTWIEELDRICQSLRFNEQSSDLHRPNPPQRSPQGEWVAIARYSCRIRSPDIDRQATRLPSDLRRTCRRTRSHPSSGAGRVSGEVWCRLWQRHGRALDGRSENEQTLRRTLGTEIRRMATLTTAAGPPADSSTQVDHCQPPLSYLKTSSGTPRLVRQTVDWWYHSGPVLTYLLGDMP